MASNAKPFKCTHCDKSYKEYSGLGYHKNECTAYLQATGTAQKIYTCPQCALEFTRSGHLARHVKSHQQSAQLWPCTYSTCIRFFDKKECAQKHISLRHEACPAPECGWFGVYSDLPLHKRSEHEKSIKRCKYAPHCRYSVSTEGKSRLNASSTLSGHEKQDHVRCPVEGCQYKALKRAVNDHLGAGQHIFKDTKDYQESYVVQTTNNAVAFSSENAASKATVTRDGKKGSTSLTRESTSAKGLTSFERRPPDDAVGAVKQAATTVEGTAVPSQAIKKKLTSVPIPGMDRLTISKKSEDIDLRKVYETIGHEADEFIKHSIRLSMKYGDLGCGGMPNYLLPKLLKELSMGDWLAATHATLLPDVHADYLTVLPKNVSRLLSPFYVNDTHIDKSRLPVTSVEGGLKGSIEIYDGLVTEWQNVMGLAIQDMIPLLHRKISPVESSSGSRARHALQQSPPLFIQHLLALVFAEWNREHASLFTPFAAYLLLTKKYQLEKGSAKVNDQSAKSKAGPVSSAVLTAASSPAVSSPAASFTLAELKSLPMQGDTSSILEDVLSVARVSKAAFFILLCTPGFEVPVDPLAGSSSIVKGYRMADHLCGPLVPLVTQVIKHRLGPTRDDDVYRHIAFPSFEDARGVWPTHFRTLFQGPSRPQLPSRDLDVKTLIREVIQEKFPDRSWSRLQKEFLTTYEIAQVFIAVFTSADGADLDEAVMKGLPAYRNTFSDYCRDVIRENYARSTARQGGDQRHFGIIRESGDWTESDMRKLDIVFIILGSFNGAFELLPGMMPRHTQYSARAVILQHSNRWLGMERSSQKLTELLKAEGMVDEAKIERLCQLMRPEREGPLRVGVEVLESTAADTRLDCCAETLGMD